MKTNVYKAKLADAVGRYKEAFTILMAHFAQCYKKSKSRIFEFDSEEIEVLIQITKNYMSSERQAMKKLRRIEEKLVRKQEEGKESEESLKFKLRVLKVYEEHIQDGFKEQIVQVLLLIDNQLIPMSKQKQAEYEEDCREDPSRFKKAERERQLEMYTEEQVMALRFRGDLYRYLGEIASGFEASSSLELALKSYQEAMYVGCKLNPAHNALLRVYLSLSVFFYEMYESYEFAMKYSMEALTMANEAMNAYKIQLNVENDLNQAHGEVYDLKLKETYAVIETIQHNMKKWKEAV